MTQPSQGSDERPTKAKLYKVTGPVDRLVRGAEIKVQFNPATLKVSLANSLKAADKPNEQSAAQYLEKSSASLTVELIFDTTLDDTDVRQKTKAIAEAFLKPIEAGDKLQAPSRCLFQWGAFEFVGLMLSLDETLDFFSPEGTPLRSSVAIKLSEDRYQFLTGAARRSRRQTPKIASPGGSANEANKETGKDERAWRDTALFNGLESPRLGAAGGLSVPGGSASASFGAGGGIGFSAGASLGLSGGLSGGVSGGVSAGVSAGVTGGGIGASATLFKAEIATPGFSFGASASLGTSIPGAFSASWVSSTSGLSAGAGLSGGSSAGMAGGLGAGMGASVSLTAGASLGASASLSAGASAGASAAAGGSASAGASAGASASASAGASSAGASARASASVGFD